jgi:ATP-binding cassette, subfamily C, bacterial CydCD
MKPLDPRLLRHARRAAVPIAVLAALGLAAAMLVIAQAWLLATVIAGVFIGKATLSATSLAALAAVTVARAAVAWAAQAVAHRASAAAKSDLRGALLARVIGLGPAWRRRSDEQAGGQRIRDTAALTQLATTGLDGLDGYFTGYLPALMLAIAVPLAVLTTIAAADPVSGITIALTLPLIPVFGALIGMATGRQAALRLRALATLAHHFHDVVSGLPTLRVFGRAGAQRAQIERVTQEYRRTTMSTLRLAFLSSFALELIATMSVALVATEIGLRLAYGHLDLRTGLLVLILAPEAYLPLRAVGSQFHATADGLAAIEEVIAILETPAPAVGSPVAGSPAVAGAAVPASGGAADAVIRVDAVSVRHEGRAGRAEPAPDRATFAIAAGRLTVITGPSGCGKTTLLGCLLGFTEPTSGSITRRQGAAPAAPLERGDRRDRRDLSGTYGWLPQDPTLFAGTVGENIRLGWPDAPDEAVTSAARAAALDDVRFDRVLGERGRGLSAGQRRRVALARALLPCWPVLLLDEPTAGLDAAREATVIAALRRSAAAGHAVVVVTHRPALIAAADLVVDLAADLAVDLAQPARNLPTPLTGVSA